MICYKIFEMLIFVLFFLGLYHKLYKRSISTFLILSSLFVFVITKNYYPDYSYLVLCIGVIIVYIRGMYKEDKDKIITWKHAV